MTESGISGLWVDPTSRAAPYPIIGFRIDGRPVLWVDDESGQFMTDGSVFARRITEMLRTGLVTESRRSLDEASPDTSQEYFLDLIARIDAATDDRRSP